MGTIKFVKEPGYTYDLIWVYLMYFNKDLFLKPCPQYKKAEENIEYFQKVLDDFAPISNELGVFFCMPKNNKAFMMQWYWGAYKKHLVHGEECMLDVLLKGLKNYDFIISNLLRFYFKDITEEMIQECKDSLKVVNKLIRESDYGAEVKSALYAFFIEPIPSIQKLAKELEEKMPLIQVNYEKRHEEMMKLQNRFSFERLASDMKNGFASLDIELFDEVIVTIECLARQVFGFAEHDGMLTVNIGLDYEDFTEWRFAINAPVKLDAFGTAISEKNRVDVLDLMLRKGEVTQREIEKELNMTPANSYYHIGLMQKANLIKRRNQGRTILYSINKECLKAAIGALEKYAK